MHLLTLPNQKDFRITSMGDSPFPTEGATLAFFGHTAPVGGGSEEGLRAEQEVGRKDSSNRQTHAWLPNSQPALTHQTPQWESLVYCL